MREFMKKNKKVIIFHVLVIFAICMIFGIVLLGVVDSYESKKPVKAVPSTEFDEELKEAREFVATLDTEPITMLLKVGFYEEWLMVKSFTSKFGFNTTEYGIAIVVGNHEGTEYRIAKIFNAINAEKVSIPLKTVADNSFYFEEPDFEEKNYLMFEHFGEKYILDDKLNVWKIG